MAYSDPQSVTIAGSAISLPRVGSAENAGSFKSNDGLTQLAVSSSYGKRIRRTARLTSSKVAADPFTTGLNQRFSITAYLVVDHPVTGYTVQQQKDVVDALTAYLTASTGAKVTQLLGGEN